MVPVVESIKLHAKSFVSNRDGPPGSFARIERVSLLLYGYIKCRGYKTISEFLNISSLSSCDVECSQVVSP